MNTVTSKHFNIVNSWVDIMRPHWTRCSGNVHNDQKFWKDCIHDQQPAFWITLIEFYHENRDAETERRFPYLMEDLWEIAQRIDQGKPVTIPYNKQGYNKPVFRAVMAIKDIAVRITGKPLEEQSKRKTQVQDIIRLADELRRRAKELYDDAE